MKKQNLPPTFRSGRSPLTLIAICACCFLFAGPASGAQNSASTDISAGQADMRAAEKDLSQAGKAFEDAQQAVEGGIQGRTTWSQLNELPNDGESMAIPLPATPDAPQEPAAPQKKKAVSRQAPRNGARVSRNMAPGYDGYMGTYTEPNGDIVTSVISPTQRAQTYQNYPIYVEPQINGWGNSGWNGNDGWNPNWNNGPNQGSGWSQAWGGGQVPGYPYPPAGPGFSPIGQVPGYPYPPVSPGTAPPPPGPNPGFNPPPAGPGFNPGGNAPRPPRPGFGPGGNPPRPPRPGFNPGGNPPPPLQPGGPGNIGGMPPGGPGFNPGGNPPRPPRPGFGPGQRPGIGGPMRPHSALTPPSNPGRPGSMPLVAPNFPPHVEHQPFTNRYQPPEFAATLNRPAAPMTREAPRVGHGEYSVPGSPQSWDAANWQPGPPAQGGM